MESSRRVLVERLTPGGNTWMDPKRNGRDGAFESCP